MAEITDYFGKASVDDDHSVATTVSADRTAGVTVLSGFDLSTFTEDTPVFFITYTKTTDPLTGDVSVTDLTSWKGLVNSGASTITNLTVAPGYTDTGNTEGQFIECIPTSYWENQLVDGIQQEHNPDGTHSDVTATSVSTDTLIVTSGTTLPAGDIVTADIADAAVTPPKWTNPYKFFAYAGSDSTAGAGYWVVPINTEVFDPNGDFDTSTYKYTAPVTGYYQFNFVYRANVLASNAWLAYILKNGSLFCTLHEVVTGNSTFPTGASGSHLMYLTAGDYVQLAVGNISGRTVYGGISGGCSMSGFLVSET